VTERSPKGKERSLIKDAGLVLAALVALGGVANMAASVDRRKEVVERSKGKCENCGVEINNDETIVGHLDHLNKGDGRYNSDSNVRAHCFSCEAEVHLTHVGNAMDIGLSEEDNMASTLSRIIELLKINPEEFINLLARHSSFVDEDLFLGLYFNEPRLIEQAFHAAEKDLPMDIYSALENMASESEYDFLLFYFRKTDAVDFFLEKNELELPLEPISFLERLVEEDLEEFLKLYFGHKKKVRNIFLEANKDLPDVERILTDLAGEDNNELVRLIRELPIIFNVIDPDLIQDALS
jgi:hypothetical protein